MKDPGEIKTTRDEDDYLAVLFWMVCISWGWVAGWALAMVT